MAFVVSLAVILLQLVQTRIFSVIFWVHLVYFIISIALLGFGISGTWLAFGPHTRLARFLTPKSAACAFVLTAIFSSLVLPAMSVTVSWLTHDWHRIPILLLIYSFAILPYFFAGWILGIVFRDNAAEMNRIYFADLIGAGLGCVLFLLLLAPLGATRLVAIACLITIAPFIADLLNGVSRRVFLVCLMIVLAIMFTVGEMMDGFIQPESSKELIANYADLPADDRPIIEFSEWNPIARIDVVTTQKNRDLRRIYQDGSAFTWLPVDPQWPPPPFDTAHESMIDHKTPYLMLPHPGTTLVIGSGGGIDVWNALRAGSRRIDAVEVNSTTASLGLNEYRSFNNDLFWQPGVTVFNEDGRSFVRAQRTRYDLIAIHAIDTFAALNAGAYVLSENYLYTVEAFSDYFRHLVPNGVLSVSRWYQLNEATRLFTTMLEGLKRFGVARPTAHVIVVAYRAETGNWGTFLASPTPISSETIAQMRRLAERNGATIAFPPESLPREPISRALVGYAQFFAEGRAERFFELFPFNVRPSSDDSPFFFHYEKWQDALHVMSDITGHNWIRGNWPSLTLFSLSIFSIAAVSSFIFLPLLAHRHTRSISRFPAWAIYFAGLGLSFIFVEIALMQRFALLLGHPSRSLAVVLGTLLISAGIGSFLSNRVGTYLPIGLATLSVLILGAALIYPLIGIWALALSLPLRVAMVIALIAPLGVLMGMPFPIGIAIVARAGPESVPWMWGINGGTTVLGSLLAIIVAMGWGFTLVLTLAAVGYIIAALSFIAAGHHVEARANANAINVRR